MAGTRAVSTKAQKIKVDLLQQIKSWSGWFERNNTIINKKFIHLDEELEKVVELVGQKIDAKFGEFASDFMELMEIEELRRAALEVKVASLEEKIETSTPLVCFLLSF
jgi:hypothetical protein